MSDKARIGISGTGFIARQLLRALARTADLEPVAVLSRRPPAAVENWPDQRLLTGDPQSLAQGCDVVVECCGDPVQAARVVEAAFRQGRPVVTMNTEFHVTCGSAFVGEGWLSEAEGDQPGCTAALARDVRAMGFRPLVYGNMKGFLNHTPTPEEMAYWGGRQGISLEQVTAFTDGTKVQMEQVLLANGCGATILRQGLVGVPGADRLAAARELGRLAEAHGAPVADYILERGHPPGVFVTAAADPAEADALRYYKMGDGPHYVFERPYHLCSLEIAKTIREALAGSEPLLNNGPRPAVSVAAIAKRDLAAGERISRGMGGFDLRGEAVLTEAAPGHVPLGIVLDAVLRRPVAAGTVLQWADVELPDSLALRLTRQLFS
ncbi:MAG: SAF domain-containing protein [Cyanobacteriota bacterium]|nr:SAF domain-containing protein [Cyanobacteriota bacterium]